MQKPKSAFSRHPNSPVCPGSLCPSFSHHFPLRGWKRIHIHTLHACTHTHTYIYPHHMCVYLHIFTPHAYAHLHILIPHVHTYTYIHIHHIYTHYMYTAHIYSHRPHAHMHTHTFPFDLRRWKWSPSEFKPSSSWPASLGSEENSWSVLNESYSA